MTEKSLSRIVEARNTVDTAKALQLLFPNAAKPA